MFNKVKNDYIGWLVIIGIVILLLEIFFSDIKGLIFSLFIAGVMIYFGKKRRHKLFGKLLFYGGIAFFVISILNMLTFKFILIAILLHFFIQYISTKKNPNQISPQLIMPEEIAREETLIKTKPLFENMFLGQQKTPLGVYEWNDINIQTGIGDTVVDLSYTMLPKGETVIFIRNLIGNIQILVPYEYEVSIHHSGIIGATKVFDNEEQKIFNQVYYLKTPGYEHAEQKIKIFTTLIVGNLEVSRI